jgi:hypothetical protein
VSFSYTLFLALLLLAPGLGLWAGLRAGERSDLISQSPEQPGSTFSLIVIVFGALVGHIVMSAAFVAQNAFCNSGLPCFSVTFDPNVYRTILSNARSTARPSDWAFLSWLFSLLLPALIVGGLAFWASGWAWVRNLRETATFGWLKRWVDLARPSNSFILAYVVTTLEHEGANVAYEGIVENIALDGNCAIAMLVLSRCDRFLVRITDADVERVDAEHNRIPLIQLEAKNFVNVALEIFEDSDTPTDDDPPAS